MSVFDIIFTINIICLVFHICCILSGLFVELNLVGMIIIIPSLLLVDKNREYIFNIFRVIYDLIIINIQLIFLIGLNYIIISFLLNKIT